EFLQLLFGDAGKEAGVSDFVTVQMQDRQHAAIAGRVQELVAVPTGRQRACLGFAVADNAGYDEVVIIERGPVGMTKCVAQLASLVDAAGRLRGDVRRNAAGEAELLEQLLHSIRVLASIRVYLGVSALQVCMRNQRWPSVPRPDDVNHVQIVAFDNAVQM